MVECFIARTSAFLLGPGPVPSSPTNSIRGSVLNKKFTPIQMVIFRIGESICGILDACKIYECETVIAGANMNEQADRKQNKNKSSPFTQAAILECTESNLPDPGVFRLILGITFIRRIPSGFAFLCDNPGPMSLKQLSDRILSCLEAEISKE